MELLPSMEKQILEEWLAIAPQDSTSLPKLAKMVQGHYLTVFE